MRQIVQHDIWGSYAPGHKEEAARPPAVGGVGEEGLPCACLGREGSVNRRTDGKVRGVEQGWESQQKRVVTPASTFRDRLGSLNHSCLRIMDANGAYDC